MTANLTQTSPTSGAKKTMLSALTPSNDITLGNYLGAIRHWVQKQNDFDCLFFLTDLHAITVRQDPKILKERTLRALATYMAAGLDPDKVLLFVQSQVPAHAELNWILTCFSYMGELNRMTQYKDKSAKQGQNIPAGLFAYPVLMAADILLYQTHLVPTGEDQKQHIELARDLAIRVNGIFSGVTSHPLFTVPEPMIPPVGAKIMSLQEPTAKMSKSDPDPHATIYLNDSNDLILKKFKRAVTDSGSEITYEDTKPGVQNLLTIQSALTGKTVPDLVADYAGKMYGHLKIETADLVIATIGPIRDRMNKLLEDRSHLDQMLSRGAERARARAALTLTPLKEALGFLR